MLISTRWSKEEGAGWVYRMAIWDDYTEWFKWDGCMGWLYRMAIRDGYMT